jgi:hypothetical protein
MNHVIRVMRRPRWARPPVARTTAAIIATVSLTLLVGACGGAGPAATGVATLPSPSTGSAAAGSAAPSSSATSDSDQQLLAYSQCMRDHGLASFPDPQFSNGRARLSNLEGTGIDQNSPMFRAADTACTPLLPTAPPAARQPMSPQDQAKWLQFTQCIRSHGVPNWPDPDFTNGGPKPLFDLSGAGLNGPSATVDAATEACRSVLPVINGGADSGSSGSTAAPSATNQP